MGQAGQVHASAFNIAIKLEPIVPSQGGDGIWRGSRRGSQETLNREVNQTIEQIAGTITITNFWVNPPEVNRLRGNLFDLMPMASVNEIIRV